MRQRGGEFSEGDFGCVVHPGLSTAVNPQLVVTKTFKDIGDKAREDHINEQINLHFPNDFIVKPVEDIINPQANPEIRQCKMGQDMHPITDPEIIKYSIIYQYLGRTYHRIFVEDPANIKLHIKALIILILKVIDMNSRGFSHNDITLTNITYKDGKAYLIDIGSFTYVPGSIKYQDVFDLLNILYRFDKTMDQSDKARLQPYTAKSIKPSDIENIKNLLEGLLRSERAIAPRLPLTHSNVITYGQFVGGTRKRRNRKKNKSKAKAKTRIKKSLRNTLK
jgi:hypothetical protein